MAVSSMQQPGDLVFHEVPPLHDDPRWVVSKWPTFEIHHPGATFAYYRDRLGGTFSAEEHPNLGTSTEFTDDDWVLPGVEPIITLVSQEQAFYAGEWHTVYSTEARATYVADLSEWTNPRYTGSPGLSRHLSGSNDVDKYVQRLNAARQQLGENLEPHNKPQVEVGSTRRLNEVAVASKGTAPKYHVSRVPPRGRKQKKFMAQSKLAFRAIANVFGSLTEVSDFVEALWKALPKKYRYGYYALHGKGGKIVYVRRHKAGLPQMSRDIFNHLDQIDMNGAIWNVLTNQLEDALVGKFGKAQQRASKDYLNQIGRPFGFGTGPAL